MIQAMTKAGSWLCYKKLTVIPCSLRLISLWILSPKPLPRFLALGVTCLLYFPLNPMEWVGCVIHSCKKSCPWTWPLWTEREMDFFSFSECLDSSPPHCPLPVSHCQVHTAFQRHPGYFGKGHLYKPKWSGCFRKGRKAVKRLIDSSSSVPSYECARHCARYWNCL